MRPHAESVLHVADSAALAYDDAGVDRTLVRAYLALTPAQRLESLRVAAESMSRLQRARRVP